MGRATVWVNRAPVLTLWAAVVAERLGFDEGASLSLGRGVAALNAQSKGRKLGIFSPKEEHRPRALDETALAEVCGRTIPVRQTERGLRAVLSGKTLRPDSVRGYLDRAFGEELTRTRSALKTLAESRSVRDLHRDAYSLYERFRPGAPEGTGGWGAKGELDLNLIRRLARQSARAGKR